MNTYEAQAIVRAQHWFESTFPPALGRINAPTRLQAPLLDAAVRTMAHWYRNDFRTTLAPAGVIFSGATGQGKTAMGALLCKFGTLQGLAPLFISCREIKTKLAGLPSAQDKNVQDYASDIDETNLVMFDDIGSERGTAPAEWLLRYGVDRVQTGDEARHRRFLIGTTNLNEEDFLKHLADERDMSRAQRFTWIDLGNLPDYRRTPR